MSEAKASEEDMNVARLLLACTAACWATYPVTVKGLALLANGPVDPAVVTVIRYSLMAVFSTPLVLSGSSGGPAAVSDNDAGVRLAVAATCIAAVGTAGTLLNTWGIEHTSAIRAALILSSINVFTPLLSVLFGASPEDRNVPGRIWAACGISFVATAFATLGSGTGLRGGLQDGDLSVLAAAVCYAGVKVLVAGAARDFAPEALAGGRLVASAVLAWGVFLVSYLAGGLGDVQAVLGGISVEAWALLVFSALTPGVLATFLQAKGQRTVPPAQAQTIYALVPLFAAVYDLIFLQEAIEDREVVAGLAIILSAAVSSQND